MGRSTRVVSRKAPHLLTNEERNKVPQFADVWVDIGAKDRKEAEDLVMLGDPVTAALQFRELRNGLVSSPGLDDKVGVWTVMEALRLLHGRNLQAAIYCVSTVQEEIGLRGATTSAYGIHPTVGIAVDVCHATDTPGNDKKTLGDTRLGSGPTLFRGAEHQSACLRPARRRGPAARNSGAGSRRAAGDRHRRQCHPDQPRWRCRRPGRHSQSLHAQPRRGRLPGRPRPGCPVACRVLRRCHIPDGLDTLMAACG